MLHIQSSALAAAIRILLITSITAHLVVIIFIGVTRGVIALSTVFEALSALAMLVFSQNRTDEALGLLEKGIKLNPNDYLLYYSLAGFQEKLKQNELAILSYKKAAKLNSSDYRIFYNLGRLYYEEGMFAEAVQMHKLAKEKGFKP